MQFPAKASMLLHPRLSGAEQDRGGKKRHHLQGPLNTTQKSVGTTKRHLQRKSNRRESHKMLVKLNPAGSFLLDEVDRFQGSLSPVLRLFANRFLFHVKENM